MKSFSCYLLIFIYVIFFASSRFANGQSFELSMISEHEECLGKGVWLKSGIIYGGNRFIQLYRICYNFAQSTPLLVSHTFDRFSLKQEPNVDCPINWFHGGFLGTKENPNLLYKKENAHNTISKQLNEAWANYIASTNPRSTHYFAKGHMAPKADFALAPEKLGTCNLFNAVPQFQSINNGKWRRLEDAIRRYVRNNPSHNVTIHTGTFGVLTINNTPLYLSIKPNRIPIPKALYKIVLIHPIYKYMVFIVANNFFSSRALIENKSHGYKICRDICSNNDVKSFFDCDDKPTNPANDRNYIDSGYVYACEIDDFAYNLKNIYKLDIATELKLPKRRRPGVGYWLNVLVPNWATQPSVQPVETTTSTPSTISTTTKKSQGLRLRFG